MPLISLNPIHASPRIRFEMASTHDSSIFPKKSQHYIYHHTTSHAFRVKRRQSIQTTLEDEQFEWSELSNYHNLVQYNCPFMVHSIDWRCTPVPHIPFYGKMVHFWSGLLLDTCALRSKASLWIERKKASQSKQNRQSCR